MPKDRKKSRTDAAEASVPKTGRMQEMPSSTPPNGRRKTAFGRLGVYAPRDSIDQLAYFLIGKINVGLITEEAGVEVNEGVLKRTIHAAVCDSISEANPHRTWLAEIDRIAQSTDDIVELRNAISAYLRQAGIRRSVNFSEYGERFVVTGNGDGEIEIAHPAYVDEASEKIILAGRARRTNAPSAAEEQQ
jgi:hypothetical protein